MLFETLKKKKKKKREVHVKIVREPNDKLTEGERMSNEENTLADF